MELRHERPGHRHPDRPAIWRGAREPAAYRVLTPLGVPSTLGMGAGEGAGIAPGDRLGRFQVGAELGRGGMGRVVEAMDPDLQRTVAIKVLSDAAAATPDQIARFVAEARVTGQLDHPNIVPVHELGVTPEGELFLVMKRVRGESVARILDGLAAGDPAYVQRFGTFQLLMAFVVCCGAVAYAHQQGVIHRDLKPDNLMIGQFVDILVLDWGVARVLGGPPEPVQTERLGAVSMSRTVAGSVIGTPGYMSPEQASGRLEELDGRSDVWSLGAVLFEILTLEPAIQGDTVHQILLRTVAGPTPDPRGRSREPIPDVLVDACMRAMARDPADRFQSPAELAMAVGGYLSDMERRGWMG